MQDPTQNDNFECGRMRIYNLPTQEVNLWVKNIAIIMEMLLDNALLYHATW